MHRRHKKIVHRDAVIKVSSNVDAKVVSKPPSDTDTDKYLTDIGKAQRVANDESIVIICP